MKYLLFAAIFVFVNIVCFGQSDSPYIHWYEAHKVKKDNNRYFEAMYVGLDTSGHLKYGTYYFETDDNYYPTKEDVNNLIIKDYKLKFSYNNPSLAVILTEFKNKDEWLKFNHK